MGVVHKRTSTGTPADGLWRWDGVGMEDYTTGATKQVLIGPDDGAPNFAIRFFTIPVGGTSGLDEHAHDHGVVIMGGRGRVLLGDHYEEIAQGDAVYIPGWERHQFETVGDVPLTFLCIIPPKTA